MKWAPLLPVLLVAGLALALRIVAAPGPEAASSWFHGALELQGLARPGEPEGQDDLIVTLPLAIAQNLAWGVTRAVGASAGASRAVWVREHEGFARAFLWMFWSLASAVAAAWIVAHRRGSVGILTGLGIALVPVCVAGTRRLEGWGLAAPLLFLAWTLPPRAITALLWGAVFSLTPLGWLAGLWMLLFGEGRRRVAILLGVIVGWALVPARLTDPIGAVQAIPDAMQASGWPGARAGPSGELLLASWTPGPVLALLGVAAWAARPLERERLALGLVTASLWWIPAAVGARTADAVGFVAPLAILLAAEGVKEALLAARHGRSWLLAFAGAAFLALPLAGGVAMLRSEQNREKRGEELDALLRREIGASGILARDPTSPAPPDSMLAFVLPTHRERPEAYDFAYWPGWYGRFTHMLFQARTLDRLEAAAPTRPGARSLLLGLRRHARVAALLGEPATDPGAWILFRLLPGPPWEPTNRRELTEALRGGKFEAPFVAGLGAFLADRRETDRGIEMLRLALRWDPESAETWRNLGAALLSAGDPKSAATVLDEALRRDPGARETRLLRARAYRSGGVSGRAVVELTQLLAEAPGYAEAHLELARAAADTKQWGLVVRSIEAYLVLEPHSRDRAPLLVTLEKARRLAEGGS